MKKLIGNLDEEQITEIVSNDIHQLIKWTQSRYDLKRAEARDFVNRAIMENFTNITGRKDRG